LRKWVNENRERLIQKRKIEAAAVEWRDKGKSKDDLLLGKQLNQAKAFQKEQNISLALSDLANEFIVKSIRYTRSNRLKLVGFGFLPIVALVIFLGFTAERQIQIRTHWKTVEAAKGERYSPARIAAFQELVKLGVPLNNIALKNVNLAGANLAGANLGDTFLEDAILYAAYLKGANLAGASLERAILVYANLERANLYSANLPGVDLKGANLEGANLEDAFLISANLEGANLKGALLISANLQGAFLISANLKGANLKGANLKGTKLECVKNYKNEIICTDLSNTKNLTPEQVKQANNWEQATYDPEFRKKLGLANSK
jgi:uncharacterized protein YjbI with pentapeptide repeats